VGRIRDVLGPVWDFFFGDKTAEDIMSEAESPLKEVDDFTVDITPDVVVADPVKAQEILGRAFGKDIPARVALQKLLEIEGAEETAQQIADELGVALEGLSYQDMIRGEAMGEDTAEKILEGFREVMEMNSSSKVMQRYGGYLVEGLEAGVASINLVGAIAGSDFLEAFKDELGIASKSKEAEKVGQWTVEGFLAAFEEFPGKFHQIWDQVWPQIAEIMAAEDLSFFMPQPVETTADYWKDPGERGEPGTAAVEDADSLFGVDWDKLKDQWGDIADFIGDTFTDTFSQISRQMIDAFVRGEEATIDWKDVALDALTAILHKVIMITMIDPMGSAITSFLTSNAKGNAYAGGNIVPFAKGGVVDQPTVFPFAGGTGLMGEAGPEAILPLERVSGGDLGVSASGIGGGDVIININNRGEPLEVESQRERAGPDGQRFIDVTVHSSLNRLNKSGKLDGIFKQHGASRKGAR